MDTTKGLHETVKDETEKKKGWKPIVSSLFIILGFLGCQFLAGIILNVVYSAMIVAQVGVEAATPEYILEKIMESGIVTVLLLVVTIITAVISVIWYYKGYVKTISDARKAELKATLCQGKTFFSLVLTGIACYSLNLCICLVIDLVSPSSMETFSQMANVSLGGSTVLALITTILIAPIGEEALLRGVILRRIAKHNKIIVAIIAQAVLFGVYHGNIVQGLYAIPMGLVLGYIACRFDSILPCILVHMVNNVMPSLIRFLPESILESDLIFGIILVVVLVISATIVFVLNKDSFQKVSRT